MEEFPVLSSPDAWMACMIIKTFLWSVRAALNVIKQLNEKQFTLSLFRTYICYHSVAIWSGIPRLPSTPPHSWTAMVKVDGSAVTYTLAHLIQIWDNFIRQFTNSLSILTLHFFVFLNFHVYMFKSSFLPPFTIKPCYCYITKVGKNLTRTNCHTDTWKLARVNLLFNSFPLNDVFDNLRCPSPTARRQWSMFRGCNPSSTQVNSAHHVSAYFNSAHLNY